MRALILAGGYGQRLKPLTDNIPKCLVKVQNKSLLKLWYEKLISIGINEIYYNSHYKHEMVNKFVNDHNLKMINLHEEKLLGTGGTIYNNLNKFITDDLLVLHCDNFTKDELDNFIFTHKSRPKHCEITIYSFKTDYPESCGILLSKDNIVYGINEKIKGVKGNLANGAIYLFSKKSLNTIRQIKNVTNDIVLDILPIFYKKIFIHRSEEKFIDIGTYENLEKANLF